MAIEFTCIGCRSVLRVPDEHAGRQAKCPGCATVNTIPINADINSTGDVPSQNNQSGFGAEQAPADNPSNSSIDAGPNPYQPGNFYPGTQRFSHLPPHRGGIVLTLGLVSSIGNVLLCCIFPLLGVVMMVPGIFAWVMGTTDLKKMSLGSMDPSGRSTTQVGLVFGIVGVVLAVLQIVFGVVFLVIALSAQAAGV